MHGHRVERTHFLSTASMSLPINSSFSHELMLWCGKGFPEIAFCSHPKQAPLTPLSSQPIVLFLRFFIQGHPLHLRHEGSGVISQSKGLWPFLIGLILFHFFPQSTPPTVPYEIFENVLSIRQIPPPPAPCVCVFVCWCVRCSYTYVIPWYMNSSMRWSLYGYSPILQMREDRSKNQSTRKL